MKFLVKYKPHSDLENMVRYQLDLIRKKTASGNQSGLGIDMQACIISQAFLAEALINMAGYGIFREKFRERDSYNKKRSKVLRQLDIGHIADLHCVLDSLQETRNVLAHAKPSSYECETKTEEGEFSVFCQPFDAYLNIEFLEKANTALDSLWAAMANNKLIDEYGITTTAVELS